MFYEQNTGGFGSFGWLCFTCNKTASRLIEQTSASGSL